MTSSARLRAPNSQLWVMTSDDGDVPVDVPEGVFTFATTNCLVVGTVAEPSGAAACARPVATPTCPAAGCWCHAGDR